MRAIGRRVHRLEERIAPAHETAQNQRIKEWVERIRRKRGIKPPTEADLSTYRGLSVAEVLRVSRNQLHTSQEVLQESA